MDRNYLVYFIMKKLLLVLLFVCFAYPFLYAQTSGDEPVIIIIGGGDGNGNGGGNSAGPILYAPVRIPIQAAYYPSLSTLLVSFMYDMGQVAIEIENQTTGEFIQTNVNAVQGVHPFSLPNIAGDYVITFTLPIGRVYSGAFEIE